jgi:DNA processing protein
MQLWAILPEIGLYCRADGALAAWGQTECPCMNTEHVIDIDHADYPAALQHIPDPPMRLYGWGQRSLLKNQRILAMVGSRNPTSQGLTDARLWASALAQAGICVASGMALGIDAAAHEGALQAHQPTVAVLGGGFDCLYPRRHIPLARRIVEQGLLLTEYPLGTPPKPYAFVKRNRILAGMTQGTLVMEAALGSGSLGTARFAMDYGREVFAVPGSLHNPTSRGCHQLIRDGATLVDDIQQVLEDLNWHPAQGPISKGLFDNDVEQGWDQHMQTAQSQGINPDHVRAVWLSLQGHSATVDALMQRTSLSVTQVMSALTWMMIQNRVQAERGGRYSSHHPGCIGPLQPTGCS